jgi:hypothetical protein
LAGKQRAAQNAHKHGLAADSRLVHAAEIEQLAADIAGERSPIRTDCARNIARGLIDLTTISEIKASLIDRIIRFGTLKRPFLDLSSCEQVIFTTREMRQIANAFARNKRPRLRRIKPEPMPEEEPGLTAEAMHRAIPSLSGSAAMNPVLWPAYVAAFEPWFGWPATLTHKSAKRTHFLVAESMYLSETRTPIGSRT